MEIPSKYYSQAESASVLVCIPLFYRPSRLIFFVEMLRTLAEFRVRKLTVLVSTNTTEVGELAVLQKLSACYANVRMDVSIVSAPDFADQYGLCWRHRAFIKDVFLHPGSTYTHFIYYEDDIRFSYDNFCYFLFGRDYLRVSGLLPSFVRLEFNDSYSYLHSTDQWERLDFNNRQKTPFDNCDFVAIDSVYCAIYILDLELASEYVESKSFDRDQSTEVSCWGIPERAALGMCVENIPAGYNSRYVVAVERDRLIPCRQSWIYHLPNNFTNSESPENIFGKIPIDQIFDYPLKAAILFESVNNDAILASNGDEAHRWIR